MHFHFKDRIEMRSAAADQPVMHIFHDFSNDLEETGERAKVAFNTDSCLPNVYMQDGLTCCKSSLSVLLSIEVEPA